jgi:uncharacterized protein (TIGR02996 family)
MSAEAAFLDDIRGQPDDDVPRLIYADWLQDRDDPIRAARGEFIRAQIECERLQRRGDTSAPWVSLANRTRELQAEYQGQWLGEVCSPRLQWVFRRGFLAGLSDEAIWEEADDSYRYLARFYPDGLVVSDSSSRPLGELWDTFHRLRGDHGQGPYQLWWTPAAVQVRFHSISTSGRVDYEGTLVGETMRLTWFSHINQNRGEEVYHPRWRGTA